MTCAVLALVASAPAMAGRHNFSVTPTRSLFGTPFNGSGVFSTSDTAMMVGGQTAYAITGITRMTDGSAIVAPLAAISATTSRPASIPSMAAG